MISLLIEKQYRTTNFQISHSKQRKPYRTCRLIVAQAKMERMTPAYPLPGAAEWRKHFYVEDERDTKYTCMLCGSVYVKGSAKPQATLDKHLRKVHNMSV